MDDEWFQAAKQGNVEVIGKMLRGGVPVDAPDEWGWTALMHAVKGRYLKAVELLLAHGADVNAQDLMSWTALTFAVNCPSPRFPTQNAWISPVGASTDLADLLREAGGLMGLREAVILGDVELARRLCDAGADPSGDARWFYHDTFLMVAADLGHIDIVRLLLDRGADIEGEDDLGARALMRAALSGHADIVSLLLDRGADVNGDDWSDETPLSEAATHGHQRIVDLLLSRGAERGLLDAVALDDVELVKRLLREDADPDHLYYGHGRLVMYAVSRRNTPIVRLLLDHGAKHLDETLDDHSLLAEAAIHGHVEVAKLLLERGADPHAVGRDGLTPLAWATKRVHDWIVECLKQAGATR